MLHGRAFERNERHDVGGADARMLALMRGEIDAVPGHLHGGEGRRYGRVERSHERDHRSMMRRIAGHIEHMGTWRAGDCVTNRGDHHWVAALGKVRDTFNERHDQAGKEAETSSSLSMRRNHS